MSTYDIILRYLSELRAITRDVRKGVPGALDAWGRVWDDILKAQRKAWPVKGGRVCCRRDFQRTP